MNRRRNFYLPDKLYAAMERAARRDKISVAEWLRRVAEAELGTGPLRVRVSRKRPK